MYYSSVVQQALVYSKQISSEKTTENLNNISIIVFSIHRSREFLNPIQVYIYWCLYTIPVHENLKEESSRQLTDQPSISLLFVGQEEGKDKKKPRTCIIKYGGASATPEKCACLQLHPSKSTLYHVVLSKCLLCFSISPSILIYKHLKCTFVRYIQQAQNVQTTHVWFYATKFGNMKPV